MSRFIKWMVWAQVGLAGLAILMAAAVYFISEAKLNKVNHIVDEPVSVPTDADSIANGKRLTYVRGCVDCHGEDMAGKMYVDDPLSGTVYAANLSLRPRARPVLATFLSRTVWRSTGNA